MHNIRRFYYQNKDKIWKVVLIIAFLLGIIYYLNWIASQDNNNINNVVATNKNDIYSDNQNKTYISDKSAISGGTINKQEVEKINNTISRFLQYCKDEKFEDAYSMISLDCKQKKYKTMKEFKDKYIKTKFNKNYIYEIEEWGKNIYRISISEDPLATGVIGNIEKTIEYITIVEEESQNRLNINNYIGQKNINKEKTKNNIKITTVNKETYIDYEIYNLKVENLSNRTIKLDAYEKTNTIYLEDAKGNRYNAYSYEILEEELIILPKRTFEISVKFSNSYSESRTIKKLVFSNLILNYDKYESQEGSQEISEFVIDL